MVTTNISQAIDVSSYAAKYDARSDALEHKKKKLRDEFLTSNRF